jgi:hypothetical protein
MTPDAPEPIPRVRVIRLTPVHNPVDKAAVGILDPLSDRMSRIKPIMPQQYKRPNQIAVRRRQFGFRQQGFERILESIVRKNPLPRSRPEFRQACGSEQFPNSRNRGSTCHAGKINPFVAPIKSKTFRPERRFPRPTDRCGSRRTRRLAPTRHFSRGSLTTWLAQTGLSDGKDGQIAGQTPGQKQKHSPTTIVQPNR